MLYDETFVCLSFLVFRVKHDAHCLNQTLNSLPSEVFNAAALASRDMELDDNERQLLNKEKRVRERYLRYFNKVVEDFPSEQEYNDYLEKFEDIVYNLTNNIDVEETKAYIAKYREENRETIARNQARKLEADRTQADKLALEERQQLLTIQALHRKDLEEEAEARRIREQRMREELERIELGEEVLKKRKRKERKRAKRAAEKTAEAEAAIAAAASNGAAFRPSFQPAVPQMAAASMAMPSGPTVVENGKPEKVDLQLRAKAGGFSDEFARKRSMIEFTQSLTLVATGS